MRWLGENDHREVLGKAIGGAKSSIASRCCKGEKLVDEAASWKVEVKLNRYRPSIHMPESKAEAINEHQMSNV